MLKRITSFALSLIFVMNLVTCLTINVGAEAIKRTYKSKTYTVTYEISGKKATVTLKNTGKSAINNWALEFTGIDRVSECSSAAVYSSANGKTVLKYKGTKSSLKVGKSISFSFTTKTNVYPTSVKLLPASSLARASYTFKFDKPVAKNGKYSVDLMISGKNMSKISSWERFLSDILLCETINIKSKSRFLYRPSVVRTCGTHDQTGCKVTLCSLAHLTHPFKTNPKNTLGTFTKGLIASSVNLILSSTLSAAYLTEDMSISFLGTSSIRGLLNCDSKKCNESRNPKLVGIGITL